MESESSLTGVYSRIAEATFMCKDKGRFLLYVRSHINIYYKYVEEFTIVLGCRLCYLVENIF